MMGDDSLNIRQLMFIFIAGLIYITLIKLINPAGKTNRVVFCAVGQGDAAYLRLNHYDLLIDAGPDQAVLSCLGKYMPAFDRKIEVLILSHPQRDHFGGLTGVINRYQIDGLFLPPVDNPSEEFSRLKLLINQKKIKVTAPVAGDELIIGSFMIKFIWPTKTFLAQNTVRDIPRYIGQQPVSVSSKDLNDFSVILSISKNHTPEINNRIWLIFTGDVSAAVLDGLPNQYIERSIIVKVPHHGSKTALSERFYRLADPTYGVISVGVNNRHGHPHPEVIGLLKALKIIIRRTDYEGDIIFNLDSPLPKF